MEHCLLRFCFTHYFAEPNVHLPRLELDDREDATKDVERWKKGDNVAITSESCSFLYGEMQARSLYVGPEFALAPKEQAVVPVTWTGLPEVTGPDAEKVSRAGSCVELPSSSFLCQEDTECVPEGISVMDGICSLHEPEMSLVVRNDGVDTVWFFGRGVAGQGLRDP